MSFTSRLLTLSLLALPAGLALATACTGVTPLNCDNAVCYCDNCGTSNDASGVDDAGCPSGTVYLITTNASQSALTGCHASASCGVPVPSGITPATWSAAQQLCASSAGADALIATTPCAGLVAFMNGSPAGVLGDAGVLYATPVIYDVTTGAPVALIGRGPGASYTCGYGEVSVPLDCLPELTQPATPCASFDAGLAD